MEPILSPIHDLSDVPGNGTYAVLSHASLPVRMRYRPG